MLLKDPSRSGADQMDSRTLNVALGHSKPQAGNSSPMITRPLDIGSSDSQLMIHLVLMVHLPLMILRVEALPSLGSMICPDFETWIGVLYVFISV